MVIKRWSAAGIITEFIQHPKGKITMSAADMNSWLLNTENTVTIPPNSYVVIFEKKNGGFWEASLQYDHAVKVERGLRFK